ncbi:hypothetical protein Tco_0855733 [Tanacetum coccineum]
MGINHYKLGYPARVILGELGSQNSLKDIQELKSVDHTIALLASLRSEIPSAVNAYLGSTLEKTSTTLAQSSSHAQSSLKAAESLSEYELKNILFEKMGKSRSYLTHNKHQALFDALLNSMSLDDAIALGQADPEKVMRKRDHDDEDPSAGPNQGKKTKRSRTKECEPSKKSSTSKETSKVFKMAFDDIEQTVDDMANDADQPPDDSTQTKDKDPKKDWFKQPPRPPNPDPKWNKCQVVDDQPDQPWFNNMVSAAKDPLTFNELMATLIDFSKCNTSITKTKAARYEIVGIEDMVPTPWSITKVGYNKDAKKGIKHWKILSVKVKKLHGYGHLKEIVVRRADRQLYKFKEGDFVGLHLNDIKDMLLLTV